MNQFIATAGSEMFEVKNLATSGNTYPKEWFFEWATGGHDNDAGVTVNGYTALTHCPLWQGINIIAGDLGQVPIRLMKDEFDEQKNHNAWQLLRVRPNSFQTPSVFIETMVQWAILHGNTVCYTPKAGSRITQIIPLRPECVWPMVMGDESGNMQLVYHYTSPTSGSQYVFLQDEVIHIQGLTGDGMWGYPLHQIAKNTIGHGLALQKHGNRFFKNGAQPGGVLQHPGKLSPEAVKNIRADWERIHGGAGNAGRIAILWEDMEYKAVSLTNVDAQWIQAKQLDAVDAARLLNLPAYKLNSQDHMAANANLEEQNETYKQMTLTRWANRMDEEFRRKLLTTSEWMSDRYRFMFDWDHFMKADVETVMSVGASGVASAILSPNEVRRKMGMPPYDGGDEYGSPHINPNPEGKTDAPFAEEKPAEPQNRLLNMQNAHEALLLDHMLVFLKRESISLAQAAKESTNFIRWLDDFYGADDWSAAPKIVALCETVMGSSIRASCAAGVDARGIAISIENYAKSRHSQLLDLCSTVTKEQLPEAIEKLNQSERTYIAQGLLATALGRGVASQVLSLTSQGETKDE